MLLPRKAQTMLVRIAIFPRTPLLSDRNKARSRARIHRRYPQCTELSRYGAAPLNRHPRRTTNFTTNCACDGTASADRCSGRPEVAYVFDARCEIRNRLLAIVNYDELAGTCGIILTAEVFDRLAHEITPVIGRHDGGDDGNCVVQDVGPRCGPRHAKRPAPPWLPVTRRYRGVRLSEGCRRRCR